MEQNEEIHLQEQLFLKYLINSIEKQDIQSNDNLLNSTEYIENFLLKFNQKNVSVRKQNDVYLERRRKNNEAAKRSRDARRAKEDEIALKASLLEEENVKLRIENARLKYENLQLRYQIYISIKS